MPETQTDKCPWQSRFGGGYIANAQYLAETMCDRMARKEGRELQLKFWENDVWKRKFLMQARAANSLLKVYDCSAIIRALKTPQGKKIYSLSAKWLVPLVKVEQERIDMRAKALVELPPEPIQQPAAIIPVEQPRPSFSANKRSQLSILKDLE